jgi:hypothetical protein
VQNSKTGRRPFALVVRVAVFLSHPTISSLPPAISHTGIHQRFQVSADLFRARDRLRWKKETRAAQNITVKTRIMRGEYRRRC